MTRRLSLQRFVKRLIVFVGLGGVVVFALVWGFRKSLLNPALAREIASQLATMLDATVEMDGIDGDPFGEVTLRDVKISGGRRLRGFALDCAASTLRVCLDPLAIGSTTSNHLVTGIAWDIREAKLRSVPATSAATSTADSSAAGEIGTNAKTLDDLHAALPGGLEATIARLEFEDYELAGIRISVGARGASVKIDEIHSRGWGCKDVAVRCDTATIRSSLEDASCDALLTFGPLRTAFGSVSDGQARLRLHNSELLIEDVRTGPCASVLDAAMSSNNGGGLHGSGRLDFPRGTARDVFRVHWALSGTVADDLVSAAIERSLDIESGRSRSSVGQTPITTSGSIKLPISSSDEEEYLAGQAQIDLGPFELPAELGRATSFVSTAEIDGLGALIFADTVLRAADRELLVVRGRYPLHRYGRPDIRVTCDLPCTGSLATLLGLDMICGKPRALRGELKLRGDKRNPQVRLDGRLSGAFGSTHFRCNGTANALNVTHLEYSGPDIAWIGFGASPIAIVPGINWGEPFARATPNTDLRGLNIVLLRRSSGHVLIEAGRARPGPRPFAVDSSLIEIGNAWLATPWSAPR
ncbi:MAG: hypothetical protein H6832_15875 [Planctomycetes bacterium]|nr:hypothetical protein [Planctomycetota bacterium]MCB9919881.1 hypothetical protein [Planctomycetota bacterium]